MSAWANAAGSPPPLICLNLQTPFVDPTHSYYAPRAALALVHAQSCLSWARAKHMPVVHVHTRLKGVEASGPIRGFEPRASESLIFKQTPSFFDSGELRHAGARIRDALVLGFTGAGDCIAAAVDAARAGSRLIFVTDAISSPRLACHPPELVDSVVTSMLGEWSACVSTHELFARELGIFTPLRGIP
jgi:hypothetical protein